MDKSEAIQQPMAATGFQISAYTVLDSENAEFRLLRLRSTSSAERIECELRAFSLRDGNPTPYKALSYQWGGNECSHHVRLNNETIHVRKNLHGFLSQMVVEQRQDWFFIDAFCINQDDEEERASQVNLMGTIYRCADEVMAWILREPFYPANDFRFAYYDKAETPNAEQKDVLEGILFSEGRVKELRILVLFNSFWSRIWIIQEVLLAKRLTVRIGSDEVD